MMDIILATLVGILAVITLTMIPLLFLMAIFREIEIKMDMDSEETDNNNNNNDYGNY